MKYLILGAGFPVDVLVFRSTFELSRLNSDSEVDRAMEAASDKTQSEPVAFVSWPSAPFTESLVRNALLSLAIVDSASIHSSLVRSSNSKLIQ